MWNQTVALYLGLLDFPDRLPDACDYIIIHMGRCEKEIIQDCVNYLLEYDSVLKSELSLPPASSSSAARFDSSSGPPRLIKHERTNGLQLLKYFWFVMVKQLTGT